MNKKDFEEYLNGMFSVSDTLRKTEHCWAGNDKTPTQNWDGGDDPSNLYTKSELKEQDYDKEDIEGMELIIKKGQFYVERP